MVIRIRDEQHRADLELRRDKLKERLAQDGAGRSAHSYFADKADLMDIEAALQNKSVLETNPMGFWYGGQSN